MNFIEIKDLNDSRVEIFSKYNEKQLFHYFEPESGIFIAETMLVIMRALALGATPICFFVEKSTLEKNDFQDFLKQYNVKVPIYYSELDVINKLTGYNLTRGVLCAMNRPKLTEVGLILDNSQTVIVLEDVENPTNVGAIFRSAAALGAQGVLLTKSCADPFYRRSSRVSMGTVFQIPWNYVDDNWINCLKEKSFKTVAMALSDDAIPINDQCLKVVNKMAIVMGSEAFGIKSSTLNLCDYKVIIPMFNNVDSLNVAAASAVAIWELVKR